MSPTVALVQSIPTVNAAMFALLPPASKLGAHRDPFAGSLRYHHAHYTLKWLILGGLLYWIFA
jgi:aspartyl/asparaginyl beta-hydroxylase (cupin superfamily)